MALAPNLSFPELRDRVDRARSRARRYDREIDDDATRARHSSHSMHSCTRRHNMHTNHDIGKDVHGLYIYSNIHIAHSNENGRMHVLY
eukprot:COSAG02_NODE_4642_length_5137_cov_4.568877_3_plen_88_part_00